MKYKAVIWDLDGTLLDTLEDLMNSVNYGLETFDMPKITLEMTRRFVGNGVGRLVKKNCDQILAIPMSGHVNSLNASVAAAILIYGIVNK